VLAMHPGASLEPGQVKGITKLVAMAVPGMQVSDVTITDSQGNILEGADADVSGASAAQQRLELESRYERGVQGRLDAMLAAVLGPGKAVTQVRAQLDLDKVTTDTETFDDETIPLETETSLLRTCTAVLKARSASSTATSATVGSARPPVAACSESRSEPTICELSPAMAPASMSPKPDAAGAAAASVAPAASRTPLAPMGPNGIDGRGAMGPSVLT
jgi:flagellar biosynthesis/type III secretory pathway M-ring protein FliF/YscJ